MPCVGVWLYFTSRPIQLEEHPRDFDSPDWHDFVFLLLHSWESSTKSCWSCSPSIPGLLYMSYFAFLECYSSLSSSFTSTTCFVIPGFMVILSRQEKVIPILSLMWKMEVQHCTILLDKSPLYGAKTRTRAFWNHYQRQCIAQIQSSSFQTSTIKIWIPFCISFVVYESLVNKQYSQWTNT